MNADWNWQKTLQILHTCWTNVKPPSSTVNVRGVTHRTLCSLRLWLCLCCSRIGYQIPIFAGFCIMFLSTISEFNFDKNVPVNSEPDLMFLFWPQCLRSRPVTLCCSWPGLFREWAPRVRPSQVTLLCKTLSSLMFQMWIFEKNEEVFPQTQRARYWCSNNCSQRYFRYFWSIFRAVTFCPKFAQKLQQKGHFRPPSFFPPSNVVQKTLWTLVKASRAISGCFEGFWGEVHYVQYFLIFFCHLPFDVIVSALQLH